MVNMRIYISPLATDAKLPAWQPLVFTIHEISGRSRGKRETGRGWGWECRFNS